MQVDRSYQIVDKRDTYLRFMECGFNVQLYEQFWKNS